jgi:lysophospholipase L1-like esterase
LKLATTVVLMCLALCGAAEAGSIPCGAQNFSDPLRLSRVQADRAAGSPLRVLAIGSSSTEGVGATSPQVSYPAQLQAELARRIKGAPVTVVNAGIGGEKADATLARLRSAVADGGYDLVLWQVGTNDALAGGDVAPFRDMLRDGIATVRSAGLGLMIIDQQYFPAIKDGRRYRAFVAAVREEAAAARVPVFHRHDMMQAWVDAGGEERLDAALAPDRFHMNDAGYACLAQKLAGVIADAATTAGPMASAQPAQTVQ